MSELLDGLRRLGMTYKEYLKSDHWADVRRRFYAAYPKACRVCGSKKSVNLHHMTYERLGDERLTDLVPLCQLHHGTYHQENPGLDAMRKPTKKFIRKADLPEGIERRFQGGFVTTVKKGRGRRTCQHHATLESAQQHQQELDRIEREKQARIDQVKFNPSVPDWQKQMIEKMLSSGHKSGIAWTLKKYRIGANPRT